MGWEGNGLLQFHGTYTDIYFTMPDYEYFYGATVGVINNTVPEPLTVALILGGLGLAGWIRRRKHERLHPFCRVSI